MSIAGNSFNDVPQFNNLGKVKAIREVIFPQDKVPKNDPSLRFVYQSATPAFKIGAVNFEINLFPPSWLLRLGRVVQELVEVS